MADNKRIDTPTGTAFVGHEWDGIEELNTPLPRWWLVLFLATILFAIIYVFLYPAVPMAQSATRGYLGWTSHGQLDAAQAAALAKRAPVLKAIAETPIQDLPANVNLMSSAIEGGKAAFKVHCVQCHGSGAAGSKGYPNLNDDDWLWGGSLEAIQYTITNGIRNPNVDATRISQMPAFGEILKPAEINSLVAYVQALSGQAKPGAASAAGAVLYAENCVSCHGPDGKGLREFGAPNLTDGIWLYGGDKASLKQTITYAHAGVMPHWGERLDPVTIKMLAAYVWSLGGGEAPQMQVAEAAPAAAATPAPAADGAASEQP